MPLDLDRLKKDIKLEISTYTGQKMKDFLDRYNASLEGLEDTEYLRDLGEIENPELLDSQNLENPK